MRTANSFSEAVEAFIDAAPWLGDADLPGVMTLRKLAGILDAPDTKVQAALLSQFNMAFRDLRSREPRTGQASDDPLERALGGATQGDLFTLEAERLAAERAAAA